MRNPVQHISLLCAAALAFYSCGGGGGGGSSSNIPRFAFLANFDDNTVSAYTVDPTTGQLRHNGYALAGAGPRSLVVDPTNKFLYVANQGSGDVSAYAINADGTLSEIDQNGAAAGTTVTSGTGPHSITMDPSGTSVYVANMGTSTDGSLSVFRVLPGGALTQIGNAPTGGSPQSVTIDPSGKFLYAANFGGGVSAFGINPGGALQRITCGANCNASVPADFAAGTDPFSVAIDPSGRFAYVANFNSADVSAYRIQVNGTLQQIGCGGTGQTCSTGDAFNFATGAQPVSVAVDPAGRFVYVTNLIGTVSAFQIDPAGTGALLTVPCAAPAACFVNLLAGTSTDFAVGTSPFSARVDPSGRFLFVANRGSNDVSTFDIVPGTGFLANLRTVSGRVGAAELAMTQGTSPVTYTPKFAYVTNFVDGIVSQYSIGANGTLKALTPATVKAGAGALSVTVDPSGRFAYVANSEDGTVSQYSIGTNGALGALTPATVGTGIGPQSVAVDPSGRFAYVVNGDATVSQYGVGANGVLSPLVPATVAAASSAISIAIDPSGRFAYVANAEFDNTVSQYSIGANGVLSPLAPATVGAGDSPESVVVDPSGRFAYVANSGDFSIPTVSQYSIGANGVLSPLAPATVGAGADAFSVTVDPGGGFAYVASRVDDTVSQYSIGAKGGLQALIPATVGAGDSPLSVAVDPSGRFAYVANDGGTISQYSVGSNGALVLLTSTTVTTEIGVGPFFIAIAGTIQ